MVSTDFLFEWIIKILIFLACFYYGRKIFQDIKKKKEKKKNESN